MQVWAGPGSLGGLSGRPSSSPFLDPGTAGGSWLPWAWRCIAPASASSSPCLSCVSTLVFPLHTSVSVSSFHYKNISHTRLGPNLLHCNLIWTNHVWKKRLLGSGMDIHFVRGGRSLFSPVWLSCLFKLLLAWLCLRLSVVLMILTVLSSTGQVICRRPLSRDLPGAFLCCPWREGQR